MGKTVLILGARGRLGSAVAQAFAERGWRVLAHRRSGGAVPQGVHPAVQWLQIDLGDTRALATAAHGASVVVHAMNPSAYTAAAWRADMPRLTQQAIDSALALDAQLLFPGNVYNYGAAMPAVLKPDTPEAPTTEKGRIRVELERQLHAAARDHGLRAVVIRAGDFFGSGSGSWLDRLIVKKLPQGRVTWPGPLDVAHAWAFLPDLAQDFVRVAESPPPARHSGVESLNHPGLTVTGLQWVEVLAKIAREQGWLLPGRQLRLGTVPWVLMTLAAPFSPTVASLREMRYLWFTPHSLDGSAMAVRVGAPASTTLARAVEVALMDLGMVERAPIAAGAAASVATPAIKVLSVGA